MTKKRIGLLWIAGKHFGAQYTVNMRKSDKFYFASIRRCNPMDKHSSPDEHEVSLQAKNWQEAAERVMNHYAHKFGVSENRITRFNQ